MQTRSSGTVYGKDRTQMYLRSLIAVLLLCSNLAFAGVTLQKRVPELFDPDQPTDYVDIDDDSLFLNRITWTVASWFSAIRIDADTVNALTFLQDGSPFSGMPAADFDDSLESQVHFSPKLYHKIDSTTAKIPTAELADSCEGGAARAEISGLADSAVGLQYYMLDGDINTFAELQSWVSDKTLVNEEDDAEWIEDESGGMFTGNTETGLSATYQDIDGTVDLVIGSGWSIGVDNDSIYVKQISGDSITAGTVADARIASTIARDSELHTRSHTMTSTDDHSAGTHKVFYSDGSGHVTELALGADGTYLKSNGAAVAPTFTIPPGGGSADADSIRGIEVTDDIPADGEYLMYEADSSRYIVSTPAGGGDMLKSVYDTDEDGDIDQAAGGLEADVSAYTGLIGLNAGAVTEVDLKSELEGMLTDVSGLCETGDIETITANWVNTANPWADNEVADDITAGTADSAIAIPDSIDCNAVTVNRRVKAQGLNADTVDVGGDQIVEFAGTGLSVSSNQLTTTLGTSVDLASEVTGTLPEGNGGTGDTDLDDIVGGTGITVTDGANTIIAGNATIAHDAHTGDVTGATELTIASDAIEESMLKAVNAAVDEDILTRETTTGDFEWHTAQELDIRSYDDTLYLSFAILDPAAANDFPFRKMKKAITIVYVAAVCHGGTNVIGCLDEYNATGTSVDAAVDGDWTVTTSQYTDQSFTNATLDAGDWIGWHVTSVSGSVTSFSITFYYTEIQ